MTDRTPTEHAIFELDVELTRAEMCKTTLMTLSGKVPDVHLQQVMSAVCIDLDEHLTTMCKLCQTMWDAALTARATP